MGVGVEVTYDESQGQKGDLVVRAGFLDCPCCKRKHGVVLDDTAIYARCLLGSWLTASCLSVIEHQAFGKSARYGGFQACQYPLLCCALTESFACLTQVQAWTCQCSVCVQAGMHVFYTLPQAIGI